MEQHPIRILLNAEPFGYGPISAAVVIGHKLSEFAEITYMGQGHTLDLPPWPSVDSQHWSQQDIIDFVNKEQFDVVLTAMDDNVAQAALQCNSKLVVYDTLTWYWSTMPQSFLAADLYLAQDYFGVKQTINQLNFVKHMIVSPLGNSISPTAPTSRHRQSCLLNFGGLAHPLWSQQQAIDYAQTMKTACRHPATIVSQDIAKHIGAQSVSPGQALSMFAEAQTVYATPGLGNLYTASVTASPTVWLPSANDSQGRQALAVRSASCGSVLDWSDLGFDIDYMDQEKAIEQISQAIKQIHPMDISKSLDDIQPSVLTCLQQFGCSGEEQVAHEIKQLIGMA